MRRAGLVLLAAALAAPGAAAQSGWYAMTHATRDRQPHWITPLATLTPLLEQEYRFDLGAVQHPAFTGWQLGGGKGLELIPSPSVEAIVVEPTYADGGGVSGWGDAGGLVKYRLAAAPEAKGNYVVTATLGGSVPSGASGIGAGHGTLTPGIGWGKGWGRFDVQQAFSASLPMSGTAVAGRQLRLDTAAQVHIARVRAWPELEWNAGWWDGGRNAGRAQSFVTGGVVFGAALGINGSRFQSAPRGVLRGDQQLDQSSIAQLIVSIRAPRCSAGRYMLPEFITVKRRVSIRAPRCSAGRLSMTAL